MFSGLTLSDLVIVIVTLLISVGFHEAMHAFTAHRLGDNTAVDEGRLTLNPLKHIDIMFTVLLPAALIMLGLPPIFAAKPVPFNPEAVRFGEYGAALVALAGPFTNLALAAVGAVVARSGVFVGFGDEIALFVWINVALFVFNMIPLPPLDGSRLLYAFAPEPVQRVMQQIESFGLLLLIPILLLLGSIIGPILLNIDKAIFTFLLPGYLAI
jgi:Zn-dependent protease